MSGTKDHDDSAVKNLGKATLELLERLAGSRSGRTVLAPALNPPGLAPQDQRSTGRLPLGESWLAVAGLAGAFAAYLIGASMGAGGAEKTLETVELAVSIVSSELKTELKEIAEQRTDVATAIAELVSEVRGLRKENQQLAVQLASLGALQGAQNLLVVKLETRADEAERDRDRMQKAATTADYRFGNAIVHVNTLKRRMSLVEMRLGLKTPNDEEGGS